MRRVQLYPAIGCWLGTGGRTARADGSDEIRRSEAAGRVRRYALYASGPAERPAAADAAVRCPAGAGGASRDRTLKGHRWRGAGHRPANARSRQLQRDPVFPSDLRIFGSRRCRRRVRFDKSLSVGSELKPISTSSKTPAPPPPDPGDRHRLPDSCDACRRG